MSENSQELAERLNGQDFNWVRASGQEANSRSDTTATVLALDRFDNLWGANELSKMFRDLFAVRGITIYDRTIAHHFTGSAILIDPNARRVLLTYHPTYQMWQHLGGHDEGEHSPLAVAAREAWEESGTDNTWIFDWPVRIDPHGAKCRYSPELGNNLHYDICYMGIALSANHVRSEESTDLKWFSLDELKQMTAEGTVQQRTLEMAQGSLLLFDTLASMGALPKPVASS